MSGLTKFLWLSISILMVDSIIELAFISSMVSWLHNRAGQSFEIYNLTGPDPSPTSANAATFPLHGKPLNLLVNQGHTSNGAAGTAFVLIGLGGILVLALRRDTSSKQGYEHDVMTPRRSKSAKVLSGLYYFWLLMTVPALLLTLSALVYTLVITNAHDGQLIDASYAAQLDGAPYPLQSWTPENWFTAVLQQLPLISQSDVRDIESHLRIMRGWRFNLIPMFVIQLSFTGMAFAEALARRRTAQAQDVPERRHFLPTKQ